MDISRMAQEYFGNYGKRCLLNLRNHFDHRFDLYDEEKQTSSQNEFMCRAEAGFVLVLCRLGADPNCVLEPSDYPDSERFTWRYEGLPPLIFAENPETMDVLIQNGADPRFIDQDGDSLTVSAIKRRKPALFKYLIESGYKDETNATGASLLEIAVESSSDECLSFLLE
ncbi:MAG: ankyrin repeat domain-containing protein, partial [Proteobacteria bacterium]|nr:ankyrin repeat domain-containing protein [Pseudomonadota bacterium]